MDQNRKNNQQDFTSLGIAIGYSSSCTNNCKHCISKDKKIQRKMNLKAAIEIIFQIANLGIKSVTFTAGEPLLYLNDICEIIDVCDKLGLKTRLISNGFWATDAKRSEIVVKLLKKSGLSDLIVSCSRWHQEEIPIENINHAFLCCRDYEINCCIYFITDYDLKDDDLESFLKTNKIRYCPRPLLYFGKAENLEPTLVNQDIVAHCCKLSPYISPKLEMYACCAGGMHFNNTEFFKVGSLEKVKLKNLYRKMEMNRLYQAIEYVGLSPMATFLGYKTSEIVRLRRCELCRQLFDNKGSLDKLYSSIDMIEPW